MFIDLTGKRVLVAGGGNIALRRVRTLQKFGADIYVVAPELCRELEEMERERTITALHREYRSGDIDKAQIVLAATDSSAVNRKIWKDCRAAAVTVNVADDRKLCDFYFPSVVVTDDTVIGINCGGEDHRKVKDTRIAIERHLLGDSGKE